MSITRPCHCDRFLHGRLYVEGRDCAKCWMFAHRRSVRKAWGANPADCDSLFAARQSMSAADLADLLEGPQALMPDGWRLWPTTRQAHRILAERFLAKMPPYPAGRFAGRGAIICGGGAYEAGTYVACRMLQCVGWRHPIQVWHRGAAEPVSDRVRHLPGVEVVDAEAHAARPAQRILGGWESKTFAIINCPYEEVLYLDADSYPIYDPDECFHPANNPHGIVTWPDAPVVDHAIDWPTYGLTPDGQTGLNGGHYIFTKRLAWPVLQLAAHYDAHSDYYYWRSAHDVQVGGFSDQEQMRAALHKLRAPFHRYTQRPLNCDLHSYVQGGPNGRPLFVHRHSNKFAEPGQFPLPLRWYPGSLPMEATAWRFFLEWLTAPSVSSVFPEEAPGSFTRDECELWSRACQDRVVLELGRQQCRATVVAAQAARRVVSIDLDSAASADFWLQRFGVCHQVWLREGESEALIPSSGGPFSACLIHCHDRCQVELDIAAVLPHLTPGAVIGFHYYGSQTHADVRTVVDDAARRLDWRHVGFADSLAVFAIGNSNGIGTDLRD